MTSRPPLVYIDANILIYLIEGYDEKQTSLLQLASLLDAGRLLPVTSELTVAETLVKPFASPDGTYRQEYNQLFSARSSLRLVPVTRRVLEHCARLRATIGGKLADSIHVATADLEKCSHFLSEDDRIKLPAPIRPAKLSDMAALAALTELDPA